MYDCVEDKIEVRHCQNQNTEFTRILKYFSYKHLPEHLKNISVDFFEVAHKMVDRGHDNVPETMAGLRKLLEAKDCAVRACIK